MKRWMMILGLVLLGGGFIAVSAWVNGLDFERERVDLPQQFPPSTQKLKEATMNPGRVVVLDTARGAIEFVLFEEDCPKTTARIAGLVADGDYDGVQFGRVVEDFVIQTDSAKKEVEPMGIEILTGLTHAKGSVGMARGNSYESNESEFYITLEPTPHLDHEYTVFGRVIRGMDVALKIEKGDVIRTAKLRASDEQDKERLYRVLQIEAERRANSG